ncbi:hypothetical protein ACHAP3_005040 [Botrytis cinerea]
MRGVVIKDRNSSWEISNDLERPVPGKHQVLVKSLITGINPLDNIMRQTGSLIPSYPIVLGCDASGVVVELGPGVEKFRVGDGIFGCATRVGEEGYGTFQEFHLMDEKLAFKRPERVSVEEAATIGVGLLTAAICLDEGNDIMYPATRENQPEWFIVLGGTSNVGQYGIKLAKLCGYQVLASCSQANAELVTSIGADATFDYKQSIETQLSEIEKITSGEFAGIFDASAASSALGLAALNTKSTAKTQKTFSTTNDWDEIDEQKDIKIYHVHLGQMGNFGEPLGDATNSSVEKLIPRLESLLWKGLLEPNEGEVVATGFGGVSFGVDLSTKNEIAGKKILVKLQDL